MSELTAELALRGEPMVDYNHAYTHAPLSHSYGTHGHTLLLRLRATDHHSVKPEKNDGADHGHDKSDRVALAVHAE